MTIYLLGAFLFSIACGAYFTPLVIDYCKRKKLYDMPDGRKVHQSAVPRLGGITFFPSMMVAFAGALVLISFNEPDSLKINIWSAGYLVGLAIMFCTGFIDDISGLKAPAKFAAQTVAAVLLPMTGLYVNNLYGLFGIYEIPYAVGILLTIFIIVFICNAINLIDGIDGLAASVSLIALGGYLAYFIAYGVFSLTYTLLIAGMMGVLLVFLCYNLFGSTERSTKIFMGDSGSLSLGYTLGFLAIKCAADIEWIWPYRPEALLVPLTLLFVPAADVVRVTLYRMFHGKPLFIADKNHIHHKLMRCGLSQHQTLIFIIGYTLMVCALNAMLYPTLSATFVLLIDIATFIAVDILTNLNTKTAE